MRFLQYILYIGFNLQVILHSLLKNLNIQRVSALRFMWLRNPLSLLKLELRNMLYLTSSDSTIRQRPARSTAKQGSALR